MSAPAQAKLRLPGDDGVSNPDRQGQYQNADPVTLRDQLNENWRQLRLMARALADRDAVIDSLHASVRERDKTIAFLQQRLKISNRAWPLIYAATGGVAAQTAKLCFDLLTRR